MVMTITKVATSVHRSSLEFFLFLSRFNKTRIFSTNFSKTSFYKILRITSPMEAKVFHTDRRTDIHNKANIRFGNFEKSLKTDNGTDACKVFVRVCGISL
jgi:hypothetical protein